MEIRIIVLFKPDAIPKLAEDISRSGGIEAIQKMLSEDCPQEFKDVIISSVVGVYAPELGINTLANVTQPPIHIHTP